MNRSSSGGSSSGRRTATSSQGWNTNNNNIQQQQQSPYSQHIAKSMTIDEMRQLHQRALREAEAKRTELRLVLASRYRELVGSSDEVIRMKERAQELHGLVNALPGLMEKLSQPAPKEETKEGSEEKKEVEASMITLRRNLSLLPRVVHRALDSNNVHTATTTLIQLFTLIASQTDIYPLANVLSESGVTSQTESLDPALEAQMRMIFLQVQTLPRKIERISERNLLRAASYGKDVEDPVFGAIASAAALSSLDLLSVDKNRDRASSLLEKYFDSKAQLLKSLLNQLAASDTDDGGSSQVGAEIAEAILSKIVLLLQHDVIVHPYEIFVLRNFPAKEPGDAASIMSTLPPFDPVVVKMRCSKFLAAHLPLIRTKVKSVLVTIAGTTASALGQIRQSLYDKTDGAECMQRLNQNEVCTWDEAVEGMVDTRTVLSHADAAPGEASRRQFSLWSTLFSNTFSSLVHSLLTTSFQSVHARVVSTLRASLANAPPLSAILPHEAYRNSLRIATELDEALLKVSDDAHELLVHAEEREESERRLRQSLYVQTCEIMGRLVCELRRMVFRGQSDTSDATKELIVGRLCYLLKFRLTSLPTLLDPKSSHAAMHGATGMISYVDLQSAFELADDNEDGLIAFEEAMEAVESAFSGTQFRGAEMVRETLLISTTETESRSSEDKTGGTSMNVTLNELALLTARGLRHADSGPESALGAVQKSLDDIVKDCFQEWAVSAMANSTATFKDALRDFLSTSSAFSEHEWRRIHSRTDEPSSGDDVGTVSPYVVGYLLAVSTILNRTTCPPDSRTPVPSIEYASSLGIDSSSIGSIPTLTGTIQLTLLRHAVQSLALSFDESLLPAAELEKVGTAALIQLYADISFIKVCFCERDRSGFGESQESEVLVASSQKTIKEIAERTETRLRSTCDRKTFRELPERVSQMHNHALAVTDLFLSSFFGDDSSASVSAAGELDFGSTATGTAPLFRTPLASSRRFVLLPVQSDRSLSELQLRGKYTKEKEERESRREATGGSVMSSGFGFFSSMLKKK